MLIQPGRIATEFGGGLALFLFGMRVMTDGMKVAAGPGMKKLLERLTGNRFSGLLAGATITAVIQSSSVTTVLVVGFITAGLMTPAQSVGVIIGANIGTTVTAQIIAFKITEYALLLIAAGFFMEVLSRRQRWKQIGTAILGLGILFFGMDLMSAAVGPLRSWTPFLEFMQHVRHPALGILLGTLFTAVIQSSSATTGIVIVLAGRGLLPLESGVALILGANLGTCVTAVLSSFGKPRQAVQAAVIHVIFNLVGVLFWGFFVDELAGFVRQISPTSAAALPAERRAAEVPRQVANAHTVVNAANAFICIWLATPLAKLACLLVPEKPKQISEEIQPQFIDPYFLTQPAVALDRVRDELSRLAELTRHMLVQALPQTVRGTQEELSVLLRVEKDAEVLHGAIIEYMGKLSLDDLPEPLPRRQYMYMAIANYLQNIGEVIAVNLAEDQRKRMKLGAQVSESTCQILESIHELVLEAFDNAIAAFRDENPEAARIAVSSKAPVNHVAENGSSHLARRLIAEEPYRVPLFQIETDIIENLKRINTLTRRIGRVYGENSTVREKSGESDESDVT